jgi:hypothetical protein
MKLSQAKEYLPFVQAAAEGKTVQWFSGVSWLDCYEPCDWFNSNQNEIPNRFRIKPEEPNLRPWKPEEVPVGALVRWKESSKNSFTGSRGFDICIIAGIHGDRVLTSIFSCNFRLETVFNHHEHSLDHGKTWLPCGVLE